MRSFVFFYCTSFLVGAICLSDEARRKKLVIDNDSGGDDSMAIFLALLAEKHHNGPEVVALTTVNGNTVEENVAYNNQRILRVAKRDDIPIYRGARRSIVITPPAGGHYGQDGLGDVPENYTDLVPPKEKGAVAALIELSKTYEGDLQVVTLGPVTNIALAITLDPDFLSRLDQLYIAAGFMFSEQFPKAEFNARMDAEAYHIISANASPDKVTVLPFSHAQISLNISREWRKNTLGSIDSEIVRAQNNFERVSLNRPGERWYALDPAMVALAVNPELIDEVKYMKNDINLCGEDRGINTNIPEEMSQANMRLIISAKLSEYMDYLVDLFSKTL